VSRKTLNSGGASTTKSPAAAPIKIQIQPSVQLETHQRLQFEVKKSKRRFTQGDLIDQAVKSYFSDSNKSINAQLFRRLDAMTEKLDAQRHESLVLVEAFHLFVGEFMTLTNDLPEASRVAAEREGQIRLNRFVEKLAEILDGEFSALGYTARLTSKPNKP